MTTLPTILSARDFDRADEVDQEWAKHYVAHVERRKAQREEELSAALCAQILASADSTLSVCMALVYGMLLDGVHSAKYLKVWSSVTREQSGVCVDLLKVWVGERFPRLLESARVQLVWLVTSLVQLRVSEVEVLVLALLRQVVTGNVGAKNLSLVSELLSLFSHNRDWLYAHPSLVPIIVYTLATIIPDHHKAELESLREREIALIVQLVRERLDAVRTGGRDLIRALYNISLIPEIKNIWEQVLLAPVEGHTGLNHLRALLTTPTPKHVLTSRISPEIETWLTFIFTHVKYGLHTWYQKWFATKFLSSPENDTLVPEIIRWIIAAHHPTNAILQSNIIPRYKFIGWLIGGCARNPHVQQNARQALFYDWLFYTPGKDNIMNIEPAALLMINTLQKEPPFVSALAEHLMISTDNYLVSSYPPMREELRKSVHLASRLILEKRVISTFDPLYTSSHLPEKLREALKKVFENISSKQHTQTTQIRTSQETPPPASQTPPNAAPSAEQNTTKAQASPSMPIVPKKEVSEPLAKSKASTKPVAETPAVNKTTSPATDATGNVSMFDGWKAALTSNRSSNGAAEVSRMEVDFPASEVRQSQEIMVTSSPRVSRYIDQLATLSTRVEVGNVRLARNALESFLQSAHSDFGELECAPSDLAEISGKLLQTLTPELTEQMAQHFPAPASFVHTQLFSTLVETHDKKSAKGKKRPFCTQLLLALREKEKSFGWRFLLFLLSSNHSIDPAPLSTASAHADQDELFNLLMTSEAEKGQLEARDGDTLSNAKWTQHYLDVVTNVAKSSGRETIEVFVEDATLLAGASLDLANDAFPLLCRYLPSLSLGNPDFVHLLLQVCYPHKMIALHSDLASQTVKLFGDDLASMIRASLKWDSYSQQLFWNFVSSEYLFQSDMLILALNEMLQAKSATGEALQGSLPLFALVGPVSQLVQAVLSVEVRQYGFVVSVFTRWMVEDEFQAELAKRIPGALTSLSKSSTDTENLVKRALMHLALMHAAMPSDVSNLLEHAPLRRSLVTHLQKQNLDADSFAAIREVCVEKEEKEKATETKRGSKKRVHPQPDAATAEAANTGDDSTTPPSSQTEAFDTNERASRSSKRRKISD